MANEKEKKVTLVQKCALELKYFHDVEKDKDVPYISCETVFDGEVFRFKLKDNTSFLMYLMERAGYVFTDSEGENPKTRADLDEAEKTISLRNKLGY